MKKRFIRNRQIMGSLFAIIIILFSIGNSYVGAKENIFKAEHHLAYSSVSAIRIIQEDESGYLLIPFHILFALSDFISSNIKLADHDIFKTFHVNAVISTAARLLIFTQAP